MKAKKGETFVGLDIGSYSIKCAETVTNKAGEIELRRAMVLPALTEVDARESLEKLGLAGHKHVRVSFSGPSVIVRNITMPLLTAQELGNAIRFEAESQIPFSIDDCVFDYQVLKRDNEKKEMSILLAAARRELLDSRYKNLSELGIYPEVMDLDIFCIANAFKALAPECEEKNYGLLNIGHKLSSFGVVSEDAPVFVREIAHGGSDISEALAEEKSIPEEKADELKILKPAGEEESLKAVTQKGFEALCEEIRNSIDYSENELKLEIKQIYLSGGSALALEAAEILTQEIGRSVSRWDVAKNIKLAAGVEPQFIKAHASELVIALGMTLRGLGVLKK